MNPNARQQGFSLLELVVAVALFAVAMALGYGGLDAVLRARTQLDQESQRLAELQLLLGLFDRDLRSALPRAVRDRGGLDQPAFVLQPQRLALTRGGHGNTLAQPRAELERVEWLFDGRYWQRLAARQLDAAPSTSGQPPLRIDGVQSLVIEVLADDGRWIDRWPPPARRDEVGLPRALRLRLQLDDLGRIERLLELPQPAAPP